MIAGLDPTHDARLRSWVGSANGHADFPIENLPHGVFSPNGEAPPGGVAIGDSILDIGRALDAGLFTGVAAEAAVHAAEPTLNAFFALPAASRRAPRTQVSVLLAGETPPRPDLLHKAADCALHLPATIGDYTDFYAGIQHAENVGKLFRPDNPLLPN